MLSSFFQINPMPTQQLIGYYSTNLIILSYLVASFASYVALDITGHIRDIGNSKLVQTMWLVGGSVAMGAGIWSMHFIGMLAFMMPAMAMYYDPFWTGLSMIVAILASGFAFFLLKPLEIKPLRLIFGGILLGFAIASMHYVGMEAMKITMNIHYQPGLFFLSILIAVSASEAALYLALKSNQAIASMRFRLKFISAFIMGAAICGMHYTGMAAAVFTPLANPIQRNTSLNPELLSISIAGVTFIILGIAFFVSTYKEAQNRRLLTIARQAGMAEVAASVLHNVGNVLNSVNISATVVLEKVKESKLSELDLLDQSLSQHANDIQTFLKNDEVGVHLPEYINLLANNWREEKAGIQHEIKTLMSNIEHIKDIIAVQLNLSRVSKLEEIVSIQQVLNEALFITGIETNHKEIKIIKEFISISPILIDKIKLLQILVNLLSNAKDALIEKNATENKLTIKINDNKNGNFSIQIIDNGIGIAPENLLRIFAYGYTTKKTGHGFGLHASALAAKDMGGIIKVESAGLGQGAIFTLELPYKIPK